MRALIIIFLVLAVNCFGQKDDKKGTIKVKKQETVAHETINTDIIIPDVNSRLTIAEQMPAFVGGNKEMYAFIIKNIKYPEAEKKAKIQGTVYITFAVGIDGSLFDIKILRGASGAPGLDKEALRVVSMMPKWVPGKQNGKNVVVQYNLPISFRL